MGVGSRFTQGAGVVAVLATTIFSTNIAKADAATSCAAAAEEGQRARNGGQLIEARKLFMYCAGESACPNVVQHDCAKWAAEVLDATPTIVLAARDRAGHDVGDVTITLDNKVITSEVDGKSIAVDPGAHTIIFSRGDEHITDKFIAREGVKARLISVQFKDGIDPNAPVRDIAGHTIWPWAVVALGGAVVVVGAAVALSAPRLPANCSADNERCTRLPSDTAQSFEQRQDDAGLHVDQPRWGIGIAVLGGLVIATGLLWHFLEPVEPRNRQSHKSKHPSQGFPQLGRDFVVRF